jgi:hypothetical protein
MRSILSSLASTLAGVLLLFAAQPAWAGSISIDFDLTDSSVSLIGGILQIPPDGAITVATAHITVPGSGLTSASPGPAQLSSLELAATINGTVGQSVLITGGFTTSQIAGGDGSLAGDLTTLSLLSLTLNLNGTVDCMGGLCAALGTFPVSVMDEPVDPIGLQPFTIGGLGTLGAGTLSGVLPFDLDGNDVVVTLVGQEVGRMFVPEPASGMLVGFGLLAALGAGPKRAR